MLRKSLNSFGTFRQLKVGGETFDYFDLPSLEGRFPGKVKRLPYALKVLLENLLRNEDGQGVTADDIEALVHWDPQAKPTKEISYMPARVILQDFTGVPAVVDLAAMRDALKEMGGDPQKINPLLPAELVIDHSVQVDFFGQADSFRKNVEREYERNRERYTFLRWGQKAFQNFRVVPPGTGIVHQVNLEYLGRVVFEDAENPNGKNSLLYPDTLVGTDSHTTMINGLGILGWGVGGIEAEAAMLGQAMPLLIPHVIGFKLFGKLTEGATATDLVLTVTEMLRRKGVVGKFVEFFGEGLASLSLADRATLGNMSPEFGCTCAIFPVDSETLNYLQFTARQQNLVNCVEAYTKAQGMFHSVESPEAVFSDTLELDLSTVEPSIAGPKRPQDRIPLRNSKTAFLKTFELNADERKTVAVKLSGNGADQKEFSLTDGSVVITALTSCTNTSNPSVMIAAGLVAKKAVEKGIKVKPWVKTSLAPGSQVVTEYLREAGLNSYLDQLGFQLVGFGCTTCIGNSGPLAPAISEAIKDKNLIACSVLSGNRNFEGRIHPDSRANYLASPPLVVAYALAGRMDMDLYNEPLGQDPAGKNVFLKDLWPSQKEVSDAVRKSVRTEMFAEKYGNVFTGDDLWKNLATPEGKLYEWEEASTYVRLPSFFQNLPAEPPPVRDINDARVLALLGNSVTTDHISPAGSIAKDSPAGRYLMDHGVDPQDFNSYGSRRGNHEVMMRGTFANIRLRNQLAPGTEGGFSRYLPDGKVMSIYDASMRYQKDGVGLLVIAGKEYGSGSSRDWAAKGTFMLGVKAVIAESFERIHRSNLIGMGVLPLQFKTGENGASLGLTGEEVYSIGGIAGEWKPGKMLPVTAVDSSGSSKPFEVLTRIDTPVEFEYYQHGGILNYVLRSLR